MTELRVAWSLWRIYLRRCRYRDGFGVPYEVDWNRARPILDMLERFEVYGAGPLFTPCNVALVDQIVDEVVVYEDQIREFKRPNKHAKP